MLIKNWKQMWKSYAVLLPALATAILLLVDASVANGFIPIELTPVVVFVSGWAGRAIKQYNLGRG